MCVISLTTGLLSPNSLWGGASGPDPGLLTKPQCRRQRARLESGRLPTHSPRGRPLEGCFCRFLVTGAAWGCHLGGRHTGSAGPGMGNTAHLLFFRELWQGLAFSTEEASAGGPGTGGLGRPGSRRVRWAWDRLVCRSKCASLSHTLLPSSSPPAPSPPHP